MRRFPEVKLYTGDYKNPSENPDAYRQADSSGYWRYQQDRENRLLSGGYKNRFSPDMKGQEIELRTIVQNLSDTEEQTVTLRLWVQHADGSRAVTADGEKILSGAASLPFPSGAKSPSSGPRARWNTPAATLIPASSTALSSIEIPADAQLESGDTIGFEVVDGEGEHPR